MTFFLFLTAFPFPRLLSPSITLHFNFPLLVFPPSSPLPTSPSLHLSPLQELASIRRREQLVREAIAGKSPGVYSQLFKRFIFSSMHAAEPHRLISSTLS